MIYYTNKDLPLWFKLPERYIKILTEGSFEKGDYDFGPSWQFLFGKWQEIRFNGMAKRYPHLKLYPFARRTDDDDVACFDLTEKSNPPKVVIIHDWSSEGWEYRGSFENFEAWLESAKNERYLDE